MPHDFERDLVAAIPMLRRYAGKLAGQHGDDLVQDTLCIALRYRDKFDGRSLHAWLATIMKHKHFSAARRNWRVVPYTDDLTLRLVAPATQEQTVYLTQILAGLGSCRYEHRRALELTAIEGHSVEEAAAIEGVPIGTMKSRQSRARRELTGDETL